MKICIFSDVHGNYDSLKLLIDSEDFKSADMRICLGDAIVMGPYPNECIKTILDNNCIWLMGNHDSYIANGLPNEELQNFKPDKIAHQNYMSNKVNEEYKKIMRDLPKEYVLELNDKRLYFTHYIWETWDNVIDNPDVPTLENISQIFEHINADYIFYGHEHTFSHFKDLKREYVCVGSLGMKYPGHYTMVDIGERGNINIIHKAIKFDVNKCKDDILKAGYPRAEKYVKFLEEK